MFPSMTVSFENTPTNNLAPIMGTREPVRILDVLEVTRELVL